MNENYIVPTVKYGDVAVTVWGCFEGEIVGDFV